jgi:hypothetical protein
MEIGAAERLLRPLAFQSLPDILVSELFSFGHLGVRHILDVEALDHVLFLLALAAIYRFRDARDWRDVLWVVSAFTVGHSVTLALAVTGTVTLPTRVVEFLIPVTILVTAIENVVVSDRARAPWHGRYRPVLAGVFGLVHGAGFAAYLEALFVEQIAVPLLGFNLGIEVGQLVVLAAAAAALTLLDAAIGTARTTSSRWPAQRLRTVSVSLAIVAVAAQWAVERSPW